MKHTDPAGENQPDPSPLVEGAGTVTAIFGRWPAFHDAEIRALAIRTGADGVVADLTLHAFVVTDEVDERDCYRLDRHSLIALRFHDCTDVRLDGLDPPSVLFALHIAKDASAAASRPLQVHLESTTGPDGSLSCRRIVVMEARPWDPPPGPNRA